MLPSVTKNRQKSSVLSGSVRLIILTISLFACILLLFHLYALQYQYRTKIYDAEISLKRAVLNDMDANRRKVDLYRKRLPDAIIIGVKKAGTRALLEYLKLHPDVKAPGPEVHFFDRFYDRGLEWYRNQMLASWPWQITMEKTPSYFVTKDTPARIHSMNPNVKIIIVVRNPVTRAISGANSINTPLGHLKSSFPVDRLEWLRGK